MKRQPLDFIDNYHIAETAARMLWEERPQPEPDYLLAIPFEKRCSLRSLARMSAVKTLRWLWKNGDAGQRATVALRVAVWMKRDVNEIGPRIALRETKRLNRRRRIAA